MKVRLKDQAILQTAIDLIVRGEATEVTFSYNDHPLILTHRDYLEKIEAINVITPEQIYNDEKYSHLKTSINKFLKEYPFENNVFIMMRFYEDIDIFNNIEKEIKDTLSENGLVGHLAKDRRYKRDMLDNIKVYMASCRYGIAVFEMIRDTDFNPNISIELGFMEAWGRNVLLLKEQNLPNLNTDIVGELYEEFNQDRLSTIRSCIRRWIRDLGHTS